MRAISNAAMGIGLRSEHVSTLCAAPPHQSIGFLEFTVDNWMDAGGIKENSLDALAEKYSLIAHSLSLSIGDMQPLNREYLHAIRRFLERYQVTVYSDHLCFSRDEQGYLYDLLPVPRVKKMIGYLAARIDEAQDILQRPLVLENISAYHQYDGDMPELEFWLQLLEKSPCELLLDINNLYVNSCNHGFDPYAFIKALPGQRIRYCHIAGHVQEGEVMLDTHSRPVAQEVLDLAAYTWACHGSRPLLLEWDHDLPSLPVLCAELVSIEQSITTGRRYPDAASMHAH